MRASYHPFGCPRGTGRPLCDHGPTSITPDTIGVDYGRRVVNEFFETSNKKSKRRPPGRFVRGLRALFNLILVLSVSAVVILACLYLFVVREYEDSINRTYPQLAENSYVYDVDGNMIGEIPVTERRETVGFEGLGAHLPEAVVAVEDRRLHDHGAAHEESLCSRGSAPRHLFSQAICAVCARLRLRAQAHQERGSDRLLEHRVLRGRCLRR